METSHEKATTIAVEVKTAVLKGYEAALTKARELLAALKVTDAASLSKCTEYALLADRKRKEVETLATETVRPLFTEEARIRALHKPLAEAFGKLHRAFVDAGARYKIEVEQKAQDERRRAEEALRAKEREEREAQERALKAKTDEERRAAEADAAKAFLEKQDIVVPTVAETLAEGSRVAAGTLHAGLVWTFELEDLAKVPREFLKLDEDAVEAALKRGVRTVEGLRIFQTVESGTRRRSGS